MYTYILYGTVLPERATVSISTIGLKIKIPSLINDFLDINVSVQVSQVCVVVKSPEKIKDYETLKNYLQDTVALLLDVYGYLSGRGYDLEITSLTTADNNDQYIFGVGVSALEKEQGSRPKTYQEIIQMFKGNVRFEQQLRLALLDFRLAIRHPANTAFHCYRAVEAMAQPFKTSGGTELKSKDWDNFKTKLSIDNAWIMKMKSEHADQQRHGNSTYMSGDDRVLMMKNTQKVIDKFILFMNSPDA